MTGDEKRELYRTAAAQVRELVAGLEDPVAAMACCCSVLHELLPAASWTGFYRVVAPDLLRIGPYQGLVGCLEIPFGRGVCGVAAQTRRTQVVPDVHQFPGHIACDSRARSEIVVPVEDAAGNLVAVLDVDSHQPASFDQEDRQGLEAVVELLRPCLGS